MNRKLIAGLLALLVAAVAVWLLWLRGRGDGAPDVPAANPARTAAIPDKPATPAKTEGPPAPRGLPPRWSIDLDPEGPLVLEGQVLGPDRKGVAKAKVKLASVPPRTAVAEDDGTFSFDKLVGRSYSLAATSGDLVGSLEFRLTASSGPAVIHVSEGVTVEVTVVDEPGKPIAGASVHESGEDEPVVLTDDKGVAKLKGIRPGWVAVEASAPGYAPNTTITTLGSAGAAGKVQLTLRKGFAVAGKVVDADGRPIAKAKVRASAQTWGWGDQTGELDVVTDDKGAFQIPALSAGTHTLSAVDGEHAPASSTPITIKDVPISGVVITMQAGGTLAGKVVDTGGKPVPFATVQVIGKGQNAWQQATPRQATTDRLGAFELRGLARIKLQARAEAEVSASKLVEVELSDKAAVTDLTLVLEISGRIAGTAGPRDPGQRVPRPARRGVPGVVRARRHVLGDDRRRRRLRDLRLARRRVPGARRARPPRLG